MNGWRATLDQWIGEWCPEPYLPKITALKCALKEVDTLRAALARAEEEKQQAQLHLGQAIIARRESEARLAEREETIRRLEGERDDLRQALAGLVGASTSEELDQMELGLRMIGENHPDTAAALKAVAALRGGAGGS